MCFLAPSVLMCVNSVCPDCFCYRVRMRLCPVVACHLMYHVFFRVTVFRPALYTMTLLFCFSSVGVTVSQAEPVDSCELYHPPLPPLVHESVDLYSTGSALRLKTKWIAGDGRIGAWVWSDYAKVTTQVAPGRSVLTCRPTGAGVV
jgi:hypothetical protein